MPTEEISIAVSREPDMTIMAYEGGQKLHISAEEAALRVKGSMQMPKSYHIWGLTIPAYRHPRVQVVVLGLVIFMTAGIYQVITALGGAGQQSPHLADSASITLFSVFMAFTLMAPAALNYFGIRLTLSFGSLGYAAYSASLWCYNHTHNQPFVVFGGAWCGLSAAFLWVAERVGPVAYAAEEQKGSYVATFWTVYQVGTMIGAAIPVGQNWNAGISNNSTVSDGTYIGLFIIMLCGAGVALLLCPMDTVIREDGTRVALPAALSFKEQLVTCAQVVRQNYWIMLVWPYSFSVYYYVVYQANRFNGEVFTVRARALNSLMNCATSIIAGWVMALITDKLPLKRRQRAYVGLTFNFLLVNAVWLGGYFAMIETKPDLTEAEKLDVYSHGYGAKAFLFVMYGYMDGSYITYLSWFFGALSNDVKVLSVFVSMLTFWSSACQIVAYTMDYHHLSTRFMFGSSWFTMAIGPPFLLPIIMFWMKETTVITLEGIETEDGDAIGNETETEPRSKEVSTSVAKEISVGA
ncbi:hypothetical protein CLAIMM_09897 [Cladophialophora immunda]|nr:hypothetical protein CLAIMM_09897 [Cladophialophora immunda]